jgi:hypothetical protein
MANFTTSTFTESDPAEIHGLLAVGTDNTGKLLDPDAFATETNLAYTASATQGVVTSDNGTDATIPAADGTNAGLFLPAEKTKLSGIAAGAEVNVNADWNAVSGDAQILNKPTIVTNHTGLSNIGTNTHAQIDSHIASTANPHSVTKTQVGLGNVDNTSDLNKPISTATQTALNSKADLVGGLVPANQLPGFVDDVLEYANLAAFPVSGESGKIYVALDSNLTYRWTGSTYAVLDPSLALGETSNTAYRGDRGKTAYDHSQTTTGNPHGTTKSDIGLGNVVNADTTTTANITDSSNKRFITDAQQSAISSSNVAIVACTAFDRLPVVGVVERVRFPRSIPLSAIVASVRSDTVVAGASIILTVVQGGNTTTCTIPIGSTTVSTAATWTIAADTEVVFTVTQTAPEGKGLKVAIVGS